MKTIERAANLCLIVASLSVVGTIMYDRWHRPSAIPVSSSALLQRYKDTVPPLPGAVASQRTATIVLFLSRGCRYCNQSMPFYQRLVHLKAKAPSDLGLVAFVPEVERAGDEIAYLQANGIKVDSVGTVNFREVGVPGTPTVLLLDARGHAQGAWLGLLNDVQESELLFAVSQLCPACTEG